jgi:hypothetical protein
LSRIKHFFDELKRRFSRKHINLLSNIVPLTQSLTVKRKYRWVELSGTKEVDMFSAESPFQLVKEMFDP